MCVCVCRANNYSVSPTLSTQEGQAPPGRQEEVEEAGTFYLVVSFTLFQDATININNFILHFPTEHGETNNNVWGSSKSVMETLSKFSSEVPYGDRAAWEGTGTVICYPEAEGLEGCIEV